MSVSDGERTATRSLAIPISGVPIPRFTIEPAAGTAATTFTLDASGSTDAETSTNELEVRWNIESSWSPWTTNKTIQHRFPDVGVKTITLAVRDRDGFVASRDSTIEVQLVPFEVENLGVQFAPFDAGTGQAGDFLFDRIIARVFWEFGARVKDPQGQIKELPHLSYVLPHDAPIVAISEGEVRSVIYQPESEDYEVAVRSMNDPSFDVSYDHLINLGVTLGQRVLPGQVIGRPRPWVGWQVGLVEIMIVNRHTRVAHCPLALVNEVTRAAYEEKVARLMRDWEQFVNDGTVYDEEAWVRPGCRFDSMQAY